MNSTRKLPHFINFTCLFLLSTAPGFAQISPQTEDVASHLVGIMNTSEQARSNPNSPDVTMITCRVTLTGATPLMNAQSSIFLYQEQALSENLSRPYRQRFLQIIPTQEQNVIESRSHKPSTPERWVGLCNQEEAKREVAQNQLGEAVCSVFLQPQAQGYRGATPTEGCPTTYKGASYITNEIILHSEGMDTSDRGFDAQGNQVWGATDSTYQFRWHQ